MNRIKPSIPVVISILVFLVTLINLLKSIRLCGNEESIIAVRVDIITISGILSGIIIAYLTSKVLQIRSEKIAKIPHINELTQKMHKFRNIVNKIVKSNIWPEGIKELVDIKCKGLTHCNLINTRRGSDLDKEIVEIFIRMKSSDTAYLYLELKSFILDNQYDEALYSEFDVTKKYEMNNLQNWVEYDCGKSLWYYLTHKYSDYESDFDFYKIGVKDREIIMKLALSIDKERYSQYEIGPKLFSDIGTQITSDILPKLANIQFTIEKGLPRICNYLFTLLCFLIIFGVAIPLVNKIFNPSIYLDIISISAVITCCVYFMTTFYSFLRDEVDI